MVNVFPEPVTPRSTWCLFPLFTPSTKFLIAFSWSPIALNCVINLNSIYYYNILPHILCEHIVGADPCVCPRVTIPSCCRSGPKRLLFCPLSYSLFDNYIHRSYY